jgi:hypothetical protein
MINKKKYKAKNNNTEERRKRRVRELIRAGYSVAKIGEMCNFTPKMLNYYVTTGIMLGDNERSRKKLFGVSFGSKTTQYYPSQDFNEMDCWEIPDYHFSDLSEEERNFYENYIDTPYNQKEEKK